MEFWNHRTFCLITGASRGIGKEVAIQFAQKVEPGSVFVLVARSTQALEDTKANILATTGHVQVVIATLDLTNVETANYQQLVNEALVTTGTTPADFDHSILVHNAASIGNVTLRGIEQDNLASIRSYYDFNIVSMILLTSAFFKIFNNPEKQRTIIQVSSLAGVQPFQTLSLYCSGKAARDMFMRTIAIEDESISTLSYAPGVVDTEMLTEMLTNTSNADFAQFFEDIKPTILTPAQSAKKLLDILTSKKYTKGEHVDYDDEI